MNRHLKHIDFLDFIRGVAIIAVFLYHSLSPVCGMLHLPWGPCFRQFTVPKSLLLLLPLTSGWCGVSMFFVVSGFCIHLTFRRNPDWLEFFLRRLFRIYLPYLVAVLFFALIVPWTRLHFSFADVVELGSHLALVHNLDERTFFGISPAFWSIAVEVQLYLLYPILIVSVPRLGWNRCLFYLAALEIGIRGTASAFLCAGCDNLYSGLRLPFAYWFSWSLGALLADAHFSGRVMPLANHSVLAWGGLAIASTFVKPLDSFAFTFFALMTAVAIANLLSGRRIPFQIPSVISRHIRTAGIWSFSIYLLHNPFLCDRLRALALWISARSHLVHVPLSLLIFVICLVLWIPIMAVSGLAYRFIELPAIALGNHCIKLVKLRLPLRNASLIPKVARVGPFGT